MSSSKKKEKRPPIPRDTQLKLWIDSGGRCCICNEELWRDGLTLTPGNYSNIAHIVSWTPSGPRGDEKRSPLLATDLTNLMLVCIKHNKLIDDQKNESDWPEVKLKLYKKVHEDRIRHATSFYGEVNKTRVIMYTSESTP